MTKEGLFSYFQYASVKKLASLITACGSLDCAWYATAQELSRADGWTKKHIDAFVAWRHTLDSAAIEQELARHSIELIPYHDPRYPARLTQLFDPPTAIFVRGSLRILPRMLAVVGTRNASSYALQVTREFVDICATHDIGIVSGLAYGIDATAHRAALAHGYTIAVLGSGVDASSVTPRTNFRLAQDIIDHNGCIMSEYPPFTKATPYTFPARNRIIAALSDAILVTEAGDASGALITARAGLDIGRDIYAIPHPVTSPMHGTNKLIQQGAMLASNPLDILQAMNIIPREKTAAAEVALTEEEQAVLHTLSRTPIHIDELIRLCCLPHGHALSILTALELKGRVEHIGHGTYIRQ